MSSRQRSGLLLAVVASLSIPSAAQTDASFAAALGKLPSGLAIMAQLKTAPQIPPAPAQAEGPVVPAKTWEKLAARAAASAKKEPLPDSPGFAYTLQNEYTTRKGRKITDTLNMIAVPLANGKVKPFGMQFIHMEEVHDAATKTVTVYMSAYETDGSGRLTSALHQMDVKAPGAEWVTGTPQMVDVASEEAKSEFVEFLALWTRD